MMPGSWLSMTEVLDFRTNILCHKSAMNFEIAMSSSFLVSGFALGFVEPIKIMINLHDSVAENY